MANRSKIHINAAQKLYPTGDLYGIFFEDINHAADGGLYALLSNTSNTDASYVLNRFKEAGYDSCVVEEIDL